MAAMSESGRLGGIFGGAGFVTIGYGALYFFCSASMLLFNKLSVTAYPAPALLCMIQYLFCVLAVLTLKCFGLIEADPLRLDTIKKYWPVPALFSCAIFANNKILQYANIETFIVVRNTTPLFVATIEFFVMGKELPNKRSIFSFVLIILGAVAYGLTDKGFELRSYLWAVFYLGTICVEMVFVKHIFNSVKMTVWGRMLYTNLLSIPVQPIFIVSTLEHETYGDLILTADAVVYIILSCAGAFGISLAGTGFRACVSATTFTLVGVVNKVITIGVNYVMWDKHANAVGMLSLFICLFGSTLYTPAGLREAGSVSESVFNSINKCCCGVCSKGQLERDGSNSNTVLPKHNSMSKSADKDEEKSALLENGHKRVDKVEANDSDDEEESSS